MKSLDAYAWEWNQNKPLSYSQQISNIYLFIPAILFPSTSAGHVIFTRLFKCSRMTVCFSVVFWSLWRGELYYWWIANWFERSIRRSKQLARTTLQGSANSLNPHNWNTEFSPATWLFQVKNKGQHLSVKLWRNVVHRLLWGFLIMIFWGGGLSVFSHLTQPYIQFAAQMCWK